MKDENFVRYIKENEKFRINKRYISKIREGIDIINKVKIRR